MKKGENDIVFSKAEIQTVTSLPKISLNSLLYSALWHKAVISTCLFTGFFVSLFQYRETLNSPGGGIIRKIMRSTLHKIFENFEKIKINSPNFDIKLTFEGAKVVACYL